VIRQVYQVTVNGLVCAMKVIKLSPNMQKQEQERELQELRVMHQLSHPHSVKLLGEPRRIETPRKMPKSVEELEKEESCSSEQSAPVNLLEGSDER
jgi:serine/threonine protein kinase